MSGLSDPFVVVLAVACFVCAGLTSLALLRVLLERYINGGDAD